MVYLDTNVLIYASVDQGEIRRQQAIDLIESLVNRNQLVLSVLSLQELAYTLAKLESPS
jgi:predicted nucleic acid-binding protein